MVTIESLTLGEVLVTHDVGCPEAAVASAGSVPLDIGVEVPYGQPRRTNH